MIISRTPFRISFFGGGTDYHTWYQQHGSAILSTTINHYCYLQCRLLPPFFRHKSRIVWSQIEEICDHTEILHPSVRAILSYLNIEEGVEINHQGDLPARSGLGSSSAFTVGLLNTLYALRGMISTKRELACEAIHIERDILKENVGVQDQIATAYGGLNKITINANGDFNVSPLILPQNRLQFFHDHLLLFFTGISRTASDIAGDKIKAIPKKTETMQNMRDLVDEAENLLCSDKNILTFGELLHESWQLKRKLSNKITSNFIDDTYEKARNAGAIGGKILGAGGGGFMLFFVKPEDKPKLIAALNDLLLVPFEFESSGSQIIFYDKPHYNLNHLTRRDYEHLRQLEAYTKKRLTRLLKVEDAKQSIVK